MITKFIKKNIFSFSIILIALSIGLNIELKKIEKLSSDEVIFLDIGQGDAILVNSNNITGLIDTGPGTAISEKLARELPLLKSVLDFVILTHYDQDHIEGFLRIADEYKIEHLFLTYLTRENDLINQLKNKISQKNIPTFLLKDGNDFKLNNLKFHILWPNDNTLKEAKDSNDFSIAVEISKGNCNLFTAGDLPSSFETRTTSRLIDKNVEVLKLGHHGSRTSTSEEFINEIKPSIGIISAGENNKYGHPHKEVLELLAKYNILTFNTFKDNIEVTFEKDSIQIYSNGNVSLIHCI